MIGTVEPAVGGGDAPEPRGIDPTYFSWMTDRETCRRLALVETHRRGTETAGTVVGVLDGARRLQGFLDFHRSDAVRVLDFGHAVEYLSAAAQERFRARMAATREWMAGHRHGLQQRAPEESLAALRLLPPGSAHDTALGYLEARLEQLRYPNFRPAA